MTIPDLYQHTVASFPRRQKVREHCFQGLVALLLVLHHYRIEGELWVDGSFVTEKPEPGEIDLLLRIRAHELNDSLNKSRLLRWLISNDAKEKLKCHVFLIPEYPAEHNQFSSSQARRDRWRHFFGTYRDNHTPKGMPVIRLLAGVPFSWN